MSSRINIIKPGNLNNDRISSWFTLRNHKNVHPENTIPGLNIGLNTDESSSIVLENRRLLLEEIGVNENEIAYAVQVHETEVEVVEEGGIYLNKDAFITNKPGLALAIQVADCAAVLFGDSRNGVIAAAHAGWRGAAGGIVPKTIHYMKDLGSEPKFIKAYVSPCISLKNFEVGEEVAVQFPDEFIHRQNFSKPHVDFKAFIRHQLMEAGVPAKNIEIDPHCTISDDNFYSYRRQKKESGRMMGIIKINR
ncbi:MAG: peptidoglycan editing factor PgeF [Balneolaceae bacterium]